MKTLKRVLFIPFILGIVLLFAIAACDDSEEQGYQLLTLSSYSEKVKIGDIVSVELSLPENNNISSISVKKTISGKSVEDYNKVIETKNGTLSYKFEEEVISGDENGVVVYSFYAKNVNDEILDASDLVLTVDLAELPLLLKYDWQLTQQIIQGEDWATPDLKDDIRRFNSDLTYEMDWGSILSAAALETLNSYCSWDVDMNGSKVESLYTVTYNIFQPTTPVIQKYKVIKLADREMVLEYTTDLSGLDPSFSDNELVRETYSPVSKTDDFTPYRGQNPDSYIIESCNPGSYK